MGLLPDESKMGLLAFGLNMLANSRNQGGSFLPALAAGAQGMAGTMNNMRQQNMQQQELDIQKSYRDAQMEMIRAQTAAANAERKSKVEMRAGLESLFAPSGNLQGMSFKDASQASNAGLLAPKAARGLDFNTVARIKAMGGPDLLPLLKFQEEPIKMEGGATYRNPVSGAERFMPKLPEGMRPDGQGGAAFVPGFAQAQAGLAGMTEAAKQGAQFGFKTMSTVDPITGRQVEQFVVDAMGAPPAARRAPSPITPNPTTPNQATPQGGWQVPPQAQAARDGDRAQLLNSEAQALQATISNPRATPAQRQAAQDGLIALRRESRGAITALGPSEKAEQGAMGDYLVKELYTPAMASMRAAQTAIPRLDYLANSQDLLSGRLGPIKENVLSGLEALGVTGAKANAALRDTKAFAQVMNDQVMAAQIAQKGPQTESDAKRLSATLPQITDSKEALRFGLAARIAQLRKESSYGQFVDQFRIQNGTLNGVDQAWMQSPEGRRSIFDDPAMQPWNRRASDRNEQPKEAPERSLDDLLKRYGQ